MSLPRSRYAVARDISNVDIISPRRLAYKSRRGVTRKLYAKDEALASLDGNDYFAPLAHKARGSTKKHVANVGNVLWVDIDELDGLEPRLARVPLRPSLIVASGVKGFRAFRKLAEPVARIRSRSGTGPLALLLEADHFWNKDRIARLPGSYRVETDTFAEVVEFSAAVYEPNEFRFLPEETVAPPS